jgi:hypothetical protein
MPLGAHGRQYGGVQADAVVADNQSKVPMVVPQENVNPCGTGMMERISERLRGDVVDLVAHDGMQVARASARP